MTRKPLTYPSLAEYAGLTSVTSCAEALAYVRAYDQYRGQHPDFENLPDPKAAQALPAESQRAILARLKVSHGTQLVDWGYPSATDPSAVQSPIVKITQVFWWANDRTAAFKDFQGCALNAFCERASSCTGTFINKNKG